MYQTCQVKLWVKAVADRSLLPPGLKKSSSGTTGKVIFSFQIFINTSRIKIPPPNKIQQSRDLQSCLLDTSQSWACNASFAGKEMVNLPIFPKLKDWVVKTFCAPYVSLTWQLLSSGHVLFRVGMWMYLYDIQFQWKQMIKPATTIPGLQVPDLLTSHSCQGWWSNLTVKH